MRITRVYRFAASHRLHADSLTEAENAELYGKCNNPYGHGHDYILHLSLAGEPDSKTGRIVDLGALDRYVQDRVLKIYDHSDLNADVPGFQGIPTTENLAMDSDRRLRSDLAVPFSLPGRGEDSGNRPQQCRTEGYEPRVKMRKATVKVMKRKPVSHSEEGKIAELMRDVLGRLGEDPDREGLLRTPVRIEKALQYLTSGYRADLSQIVNGALFDVQYDEMVIVKDIEFFSLCEHHLLPFYGKAHVAYLPGEKVIGLSKIPRVVDMFARRLQVQERMTQQIAQTLQEVLKPKGVGVICEARHFCMMMRGVEKQHSGTVTSSMLGAFRENKETRDEFLSLVRQDASRF